jgi:hypothetical protein
VEWGIELDWEVCEVGGILRKRIWGREDIVGFIAIVGNTNRGRLRESWAHGIEREGKVDLPGAEIEV